MGRLHLNVFVYLFTNATPKERDAFFRNSAKKLLPYFFLFVYILIYLFIYLLFTCLFIYLFIISFIPLKLINHLFWGWGWGCRPVCLFPVWLSNLFCYYCSYHSCSFLGVDSRLPRSGSCPFSKKISIVER